SGRDQLCGRGSNQRRPRPLRRERARDPSAGRLSHERARRADRLAADRGPGVAAVGSGARGQVRTWLTQGCFTAEGLTAARILALARAMPGASLIAVLDDIASVLDDVALLTKVATKKTAGVLGDDLALNAQQVSGIRAERELPVVWAVAKGSLVNKTILVPGALAISAAVPWLVTPLLMVGG